MSGCRPLSGVIPLAIAVSTGACGSTSAPAPGGSPGLGVVAHATLTHVPHGEAVISFDPSTRSLTGSISVSGLAPDSIHPAHIHAGTCAAPGKVLYDHLSPVSANSTGLASDRPFSVPRVAEGRIPSTGWIIDLHNGPALGSPDQAQPIACGDVANPNGAATVTVPLTAGPAGAADQGVTGTVDLTLDGGLKAVLMLHGLAPRSTHPAQLYAGSCEAQGRVLFQLGDLTADAAGDAGHTMTIGGITAMPPQPLYIVIRRSSAATTQTDLDPIACANIGAQ